MKQSSLSKKKRFNQSYQAIISYDVFISLQLVYIVSIKLSYHQYTHNHNTTDNTTTNNNKGQNKMVKKNINHTNLVKGFLPIPTLAGKDTVESTLTFPKDSTD